MNARASPGEGAEGRASRGGGVGVQADAGATGVWG